MVVRLRAGHIRGENSPGSRYVVKELSLCAHASRYLLRMMTFKVFQRKRECYNFELLRCYVCTIQFLVVLYYEIKQQL